MMSRVRLLQLTILTLLAHPSYARHCDSTPSESQVKLDLPGSPFKVAVSNDGCWCFVALVAQREDQISGIAVLSRSRNGWRYVKTVKTDSPIAGLVLAPNQRTLYATAETRVIIFNVDRMTRGRGDPVARRIEGLGGIYAVVTSDSKFLFISNEREGTIGVVKLGVDQILGRIPVGYAPIALAITRDGRWLLNINQVARQDWNWPAVCEPENGRGPKRPEGAIVAIEIAKATVSPAEAVASRVPAGCYPVRLALSRDGRRCYVTSRKDNALLTFATSRVIDNGLDARLAKVAVGLAPVPVAVSKDGALAFVGNSNRWTISARDGQTVSIIDTQDSTVVGTVQVGAFPRDLVVSHDGQTLFVANFGSNSLNIVEIPSIQVRRRSVLAR